MMRQLQIWNEVKDYMFIALGLLMYTVAFTVFLMPYQIVAGGVTGLAAIIYYATGFRIENTYIIINLALLVVALKVLGLKFMMKTIFAIFTLYFIDRKSTRLNSSHANISYAVFCLKKKI